MAGNVIGGLLVTLGLDAAEYVSGLSKAEYQAKKSMERIDKVSAVAAATLVRFATIAGSAGLAAGAMAVRFIHAAAELDDLAEKTGASVEELSKLEQQARISGTGMDVVETSLIKLSKALNGTDEESKKATRALTALGLKAEDLRKLDTGSALQIVANALNQFADGGGKSALAMDLLGKSGAQALPFLKDMANDGALAANVTAKQAAEAEELGKSWRRLLNDVRNVGLRLSLDLIPFLRDTIDAFRDTKTGVEGLSTSFNPLIESIRALVVLGANVKYVFNTIGVAAVGVKAQLEGFAAGGIEGFLKQRAIVKEVLEDERRAFDEFEKKLMSAGAAKPPGAPDAPKRTLNYAAIDPDAAEKGRKALEALEDARAKNALEDARDLTTKRNQLNDRSHALTLISDQEFFAKRIEIERDFYDAQVAILDAQIARQTTFAETQKGNAEKYNAALKTLEESQQQRNKLDKDFKQFGILQGLDQTDATRRYEESIKGLNAQLLELRGNAAGAARIRAGITSDEQLRRFGKDPAAAATIREIEKQTVAQAEFNEKREDQERITTRLGIEEERIQNSLRTGAIGEFEALSKTSAARRQAARELEAIVQNLEAVSRASENPALILQAEQARAALEKLRAESDLLGQKFNSIFEDAFVSGLETFRQELKESGNAIKSLGKAFASFANSVIREIENIAAKNLAKALFGGSGGGGAGGFIAKLLEGITGGTTIDTSGIVIDTVDSGPVLGKFDTGTDYVPQTGKYILHRGEKVLTEEENRRGTTGGNVVYLNQTNNVDARADRADVERAIERANQRTLAAIPNLVRRGGNYRKAIRG